VADIKYTITEAVGVLSQNGRRTLELNMISWNDKPAKYDLRRWQGDAAGKIMNKGVTLDEDEAHALYELLKGRFEEGGGVAEPTD